MIFQSSTKIQECLDFSKLGKNQIIFGLNQGEKSFFAGLNSKQSVILVSDFISATAFKSQINSMGKSAEIISGGIESPVFVHWQDLSQINNFIKNLSLFLAGELDFLILMPDALLQRLPQKELFLPISVNIGQLFSPTEFAMTLEKMGYKRQAIVGGEGEFSLRGDILDVFVPQALQPVRVNFFGDEVESLHYFSLENMAKQKDLKTLKIYPTTIFFRSDAFEIVSALQQEVVNKSSLTQQEQKFNQTLESVIGAVYNNPNNLNLAFTTVYDNKLQSNILSYLSAEHILFIDQPKKLLQYIDLLVSNSANNNLKLFEEGLLSKKHFDYFIEKSKLFLYKCATVVFSDIVSNQSIVVPQKATTFACYGSTRYVFNFKELVSDIKKFLLSKIKVVLFAGDEFSQKNIASYLNENGVPISDEKNLEKHKEGVFVLKSSLWQSVLIQETQTILISTEDLIKRKTGSFSSKKKSVFYLPKVGEFVVHEFHGVGKCVAIERLKLANYEKDYFVLEYAKGDRIYIPTEQANTISAFVGHEDEPKLNKLGGLEFSKVKARARKSLEELAVNLMELYAARSAQKGFVFEEDSYLQEAFEDAFVFEETPDQLQAIAETKADMQSDRIMDRLICGDVGYGKTEVALRAAYKAVLSGKQVAVLCPTTILAEQHYKTFSARFKNFMVNVERINRLVTPAKQNQTISKLKEGNIDVVIGTHRLLGKDIAFKNLGLLVLDEEQRFGVQDKEKIKELKKNVDVLTLSATPIPRTLHMSLSGIRDISIIETPPKGRTAVQTFVTEFDWALVEMAVNRELSRGGQVYFVFNRVDKIYEFAAQMQAVFTKVKIGVAHGQMERKDLEDTVLRLYNGEFQILIATTLIENGIDIPSANTIIIADADRLGLSSLYQLKGRVGRSGKIAYAYFTFQKNKVLSENALKRLQSISEFSSLGSGFKIAMRDLEIRGAGSVLGNKQHGHIEKVGYDLYSKLLQEVLDELKGKKHEEHRPIKVDISLDAFLPQTYISDENQRIKIYTEISLLGNLVELNNMKENLESTYGQLPQEVVNLLNIALVKNICQRSEVKTVIISKEKCFMELYKKEEILNEFLAAALEKNKNLAVLKFEHLPIIELENRAQSIKNKLETLVEFLTRD